MLLSILTNLYATIYPGYMSMCIIMIASLFSFLLSRSMGVSMCVCARVCPCMFFWDLRLALFLPSASRLCGEIKNPQTISSASQIHLRLGEGNTGSFLPPTAPFRCAQPQSSTGFLIFLKSACSLPQLTSLLPSSLLPASLLKNWMGRNTGLLQGETRFCSSKTALCLLPPQQTQPYFPLHKPSPAWSQQELCKLPCS